MLRAKEIEEKKKRKRKYKELTGLKDDDETPSDYDSQDPGLEDSEDDDDA